MACLCFDGSPVDPKHDPRHAFLAYGRHWETDMCHSCCNNCCGWCIACSPFSLCFACHLRKRALQGDMSKYQCCQGYIFRPCAKCFDDCGSKDCPMCCLCFEVWCCPGCAISATRMYVQDERQITTDPCDNRLIRFNNCIQLLACVCEILSICFQPLKDCVELLNLVSYCVYMCVQACMQAQTQHELNVHPTVNDYAPIASHHRHDKVPLMQAQEVVDVVVEQSPQYGGGKTVIVEEAVVVQPQAQYQQQQKQQRRQQRQQQAQYQQQQAQYNQQPQYQQQQPQYQQQQPQYQQQQYYQQQAYQQQQQQQEALNIARAAELEAIAQQEQYAQQQRIQQQQQQQQLAAVEQALIVDDMIQQQQAYNQEQQWERQQLREERREERLEQQWEQQQEIAQIEEVVMLDQIAAQTGANIYE